MNSKTSLEDLIGLGHTKLGFFKEVQIKIAELRESNLKLEQKRQQIQAILDGIADIMAVISPDFRLLSVNHIFYQTFDHRAPIGEHCFEVFWHRDAPCPDCPVREALDKNDIYRKTYIDTFNNTNRHFEITASPLREAPGVPRNVLLFMRDVTAEKVYQAKYYHAEKMATIGLLAAGVAHEINNPLTAISGFAEGLKRRLPKLQRQLENGQLEKVLIRDFEEYVQTIINECDRCRDIVCNLLTFSPRQRSTMSPVDLNHLAVDVLKILDNQLKKRLPAAICLDLSPSLPRPMGIVSELKQVVLNLVLNALDAVEGVQGKITVRTFLDLENCISFTVEDTGSGIPKEHLDKLFEPFFTTKPLGKGIGIGLSTCYNIIKTHDGEITAENRENGGAIFRVRLPVPE